MSASEEAKPNAPSRPEPSDIQAVLRVGARRRSLVAGIPSWIWLTLAGLAVIGGAGYWLLAGTQSAIRYVTEPAERGNLTVIVTATGFVQPLNKVDVSSELSGTVRKVFVDYNSLVTPGQVLAELDTDRLVATVASSRAKLNAAVAQVTIAEATVAETEREHERKKTLAARQISTPHDLEMAQAAYRRALASVENARAQVGVAQADLNLNEITLEKASIRSPIQGIVLKRNVDPGQTVAVSLQAPVLFTIAEDLKQMELQVDVDEADVGKIKVGEEATFGVDAYPDREFPAQIRDIRFGSETIQGVVTYKAVLTIDNSELLLRPGMTATAEIVAQRVENALLVPNPALRFSPASTQAGEQSRSLLRRFLPGPPVFRPPSKSDDKGLNRTIWVLRDGALAAVPIVIGATDGRQTEIVKGAIAPGDPIIVDTISGDR